VLVKTSIIAGTSALRKLRDGNFVVFILNQISNRAGDWSAYGTHEGDEKCIQNAILKI
jgi:hypothetical protein